MDVFQADACLLAEHFNKETEMTTFTNTLAALGLVVTTFSASAFADTYHHVDQLALQIEVESKQIVNESRHYRHTPEYRHIVADAREVSRLASHIHELAHHHGSLAHLESDLAQLDAKFHHMESTFDQVELHAAHGHGHVHGNTSHVKRLLNSIASHIHHLQEDLQSMRTPIHAVHPVVVRRPSIYRTPYSNYWGSYNTRPQSNWYGHGSHGRGISIGGGSSRFTIRF